MLHKCQVPEAAPGYSGFQKDPLGDLIDHKATQMATGHISGREQQLELPRGSGVGAPS